MTNQDTVDKLRRAYARIMGLRENLPEHRAEERYVAEYHEALDHLSDLGLDVDKFRIPDDAVTARVQSTNPARGIKHYTKERYVDIPYLRAKLDAALGYVDMLLKEPPRELGFPRT